LPTFWPALMSLHSFVADSPTLIESPRLAWRKVTGRRPASPARSNCLCLDPLFDSHFFPLQGFYRGAACSGMTRRLLETSRLDSSFSAPLDNDLPRTRQSHGTPLRYINQTIQSFACVPCLLPMASEWGPCAMFPFRTAGIWGGLQFRSGWEPPPPPAV